jgi:D-sedoheptulose 7-phosphate isomerase
MEPSQHIARIFEDSLDSIRKAASLIAPQVEEASILMIRSLFDGGKILVCGNGGSAADAQHFSAEMLNRFEMERPPLPAIALTTDTSTLTSIANDFTYQEVFAKQVRALGQPKDTLLVITTSGNSDNLSRAVSAAHDKDMCCVALNGKSGGDLSKLLTQGDVNIIVPGASTARIQEIHGIVIHCFCDLIDRHWLGIHD